MSVAIIVIAYAGDLFTSYASSGNSLPTHLYAYGMLAYSTNIIIAAVLFTYYVAAILLISPPGPGTNPVSMISMYAMVLLLGRALSWSEKRRGSVLKRCKTRIGCRSWKAAHALPMPFMMR